MREALGVLVLALSVGCGNMAAAGDGGGGAGGGSGGTPDDASGSRIKARVQSTADGAKAFAGFYDTTLSTACAFGHAADDTLRCMPTTSAFVGTYRGDAGCTTPVACSSTGCAPTYATVSTCVDSSVDIAP